MGFKDILFWNLCGFMLILFSELVSFIPHNTIFFPMRWVVTKTLHPSVAAPAPFVKW